MSVLRFSLTIIITSYVVCFAVPAISARRLKKGEFAAWKARFNALQQTVLNELVAEKVKRFTLETTVLNELAAEKKKRFTLETTVLNELAAEKEKRLTLEKKQTRLEDRLHSLQNGLSYEKHRRTELEHQLAKLKGELKDQQNRVQKAVENVTLSCCVPPLHNIKELAKLLELSIIIQLPEGAVQRYSDLCGQGHCECDTNPDLQLEMHSVKNSPMSLHGDWSAWGSWGDCTRACEDGLRKRFRTCTNPPPTNGGRECVAHSQDIELCNNEPCNPPVLRHARVIGDGKGPGVNQFNSPYCVAVSPAGGRFYVGDTYNHRVKIYSDDGTIIKTFGTPGQRDGQFGRPVGLAVNSHEDVIIAFTSNNRIVVFDRDGQFKYTFGTKGSNTGQFISPWGVAVDLSDNMYICDAGNKRIQVFTRTGEFILQFGRAGSAPGELSSPRYVSVAMTTGRVYVTENGNDRVSVFTAEGDFIFTFGTAGEANGEMREPRGIDIDEHGFVILCDSNNHRIQVFHADGKFISTFGSEGVNNGQFDRPQSLAIMQNGDVIVVDWGNNRIQIVSK